MKALQALLFLRGFTVGGCGIDGELGPDTLSALRSFQIAADLQATGKTDAGTWAALIG